MQMCTTNERDAIGQVDTEYKGRPKVPDPHRDSLGTGNTRARYGRDKADLYWHPADIKRARCTVAAIERYQLVHCDI